MDYTTMTNEELRLEVAKRKGAVEMHHCYHDECGSISAFYPEDWEILGENDFQWPCFIEVLTSGDKIHLPVPDWPTDISAAWRLVEEMGRANRANVSYYAAEEIWYCVTTDSYSQTFITVRAPTAPRAICIAWLQWKDAETARELA